MVKKRQVLPTLDSAIIALSRMSEDAAKLELMDNEQASRRLKRSIMDFKKNELYKLSNLAADIRMEIMDRPRKKKNAPPHAFKAKTTEDINSINTNQ